MAGEPTFLIHQTTDVPKIEICALMMSATAPWTQYGMDYQQCLSAFEGPCKEIYTLEHSGETGGFVILQVCGTFNGYIQTLCIQEKYRGKGLGKKLLQFCEDRILNFSPNIFICVSDFNKGALKLYQEFGFELIGELKDFMKDGISELLLRKSFGPRIGYKPAVIIH
jgi:[ribosomal protein S18]-alanine N-acetyltransferase